MDNRTAAAPAINPLPADRQAELKSIQDFATAIMLVCFHGDKAVPVAKAEVLAEWVKAISEMKRLAPIIIGLFVRYKVGAQPVKRFLLKAESAHIGNFNGDEEARAALSELADHVRLTPSPVTQADDALSKKESRLRAVERRFRELWVDPNYPKQEMIVAKLMQEFEVSRSTIMAYLNTLRDDPTFPKRGRMPLQRSNRMQSIDPKHSTKPK